MSMPNQLSAHLSSQVDALRSVKPAHEQIVQAQNNLDALMQDRTRPHRSRAIGNWLTAAAAGVAAVAIVLLLPTVSQNVAFADVQRHFSGFETLSFIIDTRVGGQTIQQSRVYVNEAGDVRTDVGRDVSVIVNASRKEVLTLAHGPRVAMLMPVTEAPKSEDPLAWLAELRAYQNAAKPLGMKVVDGKTAHGWELEIQGMQTQLWADDNGLPLSMKMEQQAMELQMQFTFDSPLAADLFSIEIPQGYRPASED